MLRARWSLACKCSPRRPLPYSPQVAKDAAGAMEAQLQRMHAENASLREGGGLEDELLLASEQVSLVNCH